MVGNTVITSFVRMYVVIMHEYESAFLPIHAHKPCCNLLIAFVSRKTVCISQYFIPECKTWTYAITDTAANTVTAQIYAVYK